MHFYDQYFRFFLGQTISSLIHNNFSGKTKKTVMATKRGKIKEKELCRYKNKMKQAGSRKSVEGNKSPFL